MKKETTFSCIPDDFLEFPTDYFFTKKEFYEYLVKEINGKDNIADSIEIAINSFGKIRDYKIVIENNVIAILYNQYVPTLANILYIPLSETQ